MRGIARERVIVDPGMGFFVGSAPENSVAMLCSVGAIASRYGAPVMIFSLAQVLPRRSDRAPSRGARRRDPGRRAVGRVRRRLLHPHP